MTQYDFDYFVIGAGSGGVRSARIAAGHGVKVGIAEELYLGGTCVNVGCVPKKLFSYAAHFAHDFEDAEGFGWDRMHTTHDWNTLITNKNKEIERLNGIYKGLLDKTGVKQFNGRAVLKDPHTIQIDDDIVTAEKILIATGGWPSLPGVEGEEHAITSNEVFYLDQRPERILIAGGGYIAVEFAGIFHGLGSNVTQIYRGDLFLRGFDQDVRQHLANEMRKKGIDLRFNAPVIEKIEKTGGGDLNVTLVDGSVEKTDCVLFAIGRTPKTKDMGLEKAGIELDKKGAIVVNDGYQTSVDHIYAVGDVTNRVNLTPVAIAEGHYLADALFAAPCPDVSYDFIPSAIFSSPPIGTVGYSEQDAQEKYGEITVYESNFKPLKHTLSGRDERTYMKLIVETRSDRVVGAHMMGLDAPEILQGIGIAIKAGATKADFDATLGIHPTAAEEFVTMRTPR